MLYVQRPRRRRGRGRALGSHPYRPGGGRVRASGDRLLANVQAPRACRYVSNVKMVGSQSCAAEPGQGDAGQDE